MVRYCVSCIWYDWGDTEMVPESPARIRGEKPVREHSSPAGYTPVKKPELKKVKVEVLYLVLQHFFVIQKNLALVWHIHEATQ